MQPAVEQCLHGAELWLHRVRGCEIKHTALSHQKSTDVREEVLSEAALFLGSDIRGHDKLRMIFSQPVAERSF